MAADENPTPDQAHAARATARPWWRVLAVVQIVGLGVSAAAIFLSESSYLLRDPWNLLLFVGIYGYTAGQAAIAAIVTTFGPGSWLRRFTVPPLLLSAQVVLQLAVPVSRSRDLGIAFLAALAILILWSVVQIPLWIARYGFRWRVLAGSEGSAPSAEQFTIRQILLFTFVVAIALGLGKLAVDDDLLIETFSIDAHSAIGFGVLFAGIAVVTATTTYFTLRDGSLASNLAIGSVVAGLAAFATNVATLSVTDPSDLEAYLFVTLALFAQHLWLTTNLLPLRRAGYRLKRIAT